MSDDGEELYPAGTDVPGTPKPFPFDMLAGMAGLAAVILAVVAVFAEPLVTYGYWLACLDWLALTVLAIARGENAKGIWLGSIGVLAPLVTSVIFGSQVLTQIPG